MDLGPQIYLPGMALGAGINSTNGAVKGDAVVRTQPESEALNPSQKLVLSLKKMETTEDLEHALGLSISAEGRYGMVSGSAQFNFSNEQHVNTYSLSVALCVDAINSFVRMRDVQLKPGAVNRLVADPAAFFDGFGDSFVVGLQTGGQLVCVFQIQTRSENERQNISASLDISAQGLVASGSVSAEMQNKLNKLTQQHSSNTTIFRVGGNPATPLPDRVDTAIAYALSFGSEVTQFGAPIRVLLQSYRAADNFPMERPFVVPQADQIANLQDWLRRRRDAIQLSNQIYYVLGHQEQFPGIASRVQELTQRAREIAHAIDDMSEKIRTFASRPMECPAPDWGAPSIALPLWGDPVYAKWAQFQEHLGNVQGGLIQGSDGWKWQSYEHGRIYVRPDNGACYELHGDIYLAYAADQHHNGRMGYPTSDELPARRINPTGPFGRVSRFIKGYILWYPIGNNFNERTKFVFPQPPGPGPIPLPPWIL
jgi:hypothetical protein